MIVFIRLRVMCFSHTSVKSETVKTQKQELLNKPVHSRRKALPIWLRRTQLPSMGVKMS